MIKRFSLLTKKQGVTDKQFMERWAHHGDLVAKMPGLRRYVQSHVVHREFVDSLEKIYPIVDGFAELYFDDYESMQEALKSAEHEPLIADGDTFIGGLKTYLCDELTLLEGPKEGKLKRISLINPFHGMGRDEFMRRWYRHGEIVTELPGIHHYVQSHFKAVEIGDKDFDCDCWGIGSQWFDGEADIRKADTSEVHDGVLLDDGRGFLRSMSVYFTREKVIIG